MYLEIQQEIRRKYVKIVQDVLGLEVEEPPLEYPPRVEMGDLSIAACFELARKLRQPPRTIAERVAERFLPLEGVERVTLAGAGYLNLHLARVDVASALFRLRTSSSEFGPPQGGKILVEHTSINPNKAAHVGHLRNAVLGDTFARLLRFKGHRVEVQNYIDNTGVQVADVVVGFIHLQKKGSEDVRRLICDSKDRFDYYCWDLYAQVFQRYQDEPDSLRLRSEALKAIEHGEGESAAIAHLVSEAIVRRHLQTMERLNVRYNLLVQESEILRLDFWKSAFELLKKNGAIRFEDSGKNRGCWVMSLDGSGPSEPGEESGSEDVKIIVRSDGTVTYVGKDIAYHLWKFGLLGKDFGYEPFYGYAGGYDVWRTSVQRNSGAPPFGVASEAYAVIDTRQSYLQEIVGAALRALGYQQEAAHLHHFDYEVVGLTPGCAEEMGFELSEEDRARSYVEVSGRKGLGIKADDLIDSLLKKALAEVRSREMTPDAAEQQTYARMIAVAALRYFLLKFSRRVIIAFDFKDALAFEGETGPYLQYTAVRAQNILRKFEQAHPEFSSLRPESLRDQISADRLESFFTGEDGNAFWELTLLAAQLEPTVDQAVTGTEPAVLAKYAFRLAQAFNNFYHRFHILNEPDANRQSCLLYLVCLVHATLKRTLDLMGIETPERM